jgi:alkanesulfonate monooxygenase SsuD/methylene tetrahydromethanopterin reductase-like flavin-dependent oxidoreductase (luciferase family)
MTGDDILLLLCWKQRKSVMGIREEQSGMKYGFIISCGDVHTVAELAYEAEQAGWDGAFYWDGIYIEQAEHVYDPWIVMAAMALRTQHIRLSAIVTPLSRRRPWKVAREALTLDHLSRGRFTLSVGLGALDDGGFSKVGEVTDLKERAELLDESLEILTGLWSGEPFSYQGKHYQLDEMRFRPTPLSHIPIWVIGAWPYHKSMQRALRYDGVIPTKPRAEMTPDDTRAIREYVVQHRVADTPFEIVWEGTTPGDDPEKAAALVRPWQEAGVTWWMESDWATSDPETLRRRIRQGPPRVD